MSRNVLKILQIVTIPILLLINVFTVIVAYKNGIWKGMDKVIGATECKSSKKWFKEV